MKKVTEIVAELARPVVEEHGCTLWDVEYVREAGQWYLRLLIDKQGGVDILDCEANECIFICDFVHVNQILSKCWTWIFLWYAFWL